MTWNHGFEKVLGADIETERCVNGLNGDCRIRGREGEGWWLDGSEN